MTLIYGCRGRAKQSWQTWSMPIRLMTGRGHCYSVRRASASPIAASFSPREVLNRSGLTASVITSIAPMAKAIHTGNSSMAMTSLHGTRPTILMSIEVTTQQSASSLRTSRSDCLNSVGRMVMAGLSFVPSSTDPFPSLVGAALQCGTDQALTKRWLQGDHQQRLRRIAAVLELLRRGVSTIRLTLPPATGPI